MKWPVHLLVIWQLRRLMWRLLDGSDSTAARAFIKMMLNFFTYPSAKLRSDAIGEAAESRATCSATYFDY